MRVILAFAVALSGATGQSFFNTRALGELVPPADARSLGLGSPAALSYMNPGLLVHLPRTAFSGSLLGSATVGSQDGSNRMVSTVRPSGLHAAAPLPFGSRLLLGLDQRFGQDFDIWTESLPGGTHRYRVVGRGGIYSFNVGLGWSFFDLACLGFEYSRLLGSSREDWLLELSNGEYSTTDTVQVDYSGNAVKLGLSVQSGPFALGATWRPALRLDAETHLRVHGRVEDSVISRALDLPHEITVGGAYRPWERLNVLAGFEYRPWSGFTVDGEARDFLDAWRASAGLEFAVAPGYPVRLGYSYEPWYYESASGPVTAQGIHLGTSIPIPEFGSLDIGAEVSRRTSGTMTETVGRLLFSLSYHEAWSKRTRRWGS